MVVNLVSAVICLGLSAVYHQFMFCSKHVCDKLATLDYGGICVLIMGSCYPAIFYPFACEPFFNIRNTFLIIITAGATCAFLSLLNDRLAGSECKGYRAGMFTVLGVSSLGPLVYLAYTDGGVYVSYFSLKPFVIGGFTYFFGAVLYAFKIPEVFVKGRFDIIGSSHQLFHIFVVVGAMIHFMAGVELYQKRTEMVCPVELPIII